MKTSVLFGASILAMFAANESFAAGYICEESRVYTSCGAGLYLKENDFAGSGVGTCEACPDGFTDGTGIVGRANCVNNNAPKGQYYSYDEGTGTGTFLPCPAGHYCTGGSLTYDTAVSGGGGAKQCYNPDSPASLTVALKNLINNKLTEAGKGRTISSIDTGTFAGFMNQNSNVTITSDGGLTADSIGSCYFEIPDNKRLSFVPYGTTLGAYRPQLSDCGTGTVSYNKTILFDEIADDVVSGTVNSLPNPLYISICDGCGNGYYVSSDSTGCTACDPNGVLGIDVTGTFIDDRNIKLAGTTIADLVCPYKFSSLEFEHGKADNVICYLSNNASTVEKGKAYTCMVFVSQGASSGTGYFGVVGCEPGYVLSNNGGACGTTSNGIPQALTVTDSYLVVNDPKSLKCEEVRAGCYQELDVDGFDDLDNVLQLKTLLSGTQCPSGSYCVGGVNSRQACPNFEDLEGTILSPASPIGANMEDQCYIPAGDTKLVDEKGTFYFGNKCDW